MTTIAANRKVMAGDSRVTGGIPMYHTDKIFHIGSSIVGVCGDVHLTTKWLAWFRRECPHDEAPLVPEEDESFLALVLNDKGLFLYSNCMEPDQLHENFYAIGTGSSYAMMAMLSGNTPAQAVRAAMKYDENTGGRVKELALHILKKPKERIKQTGDDGSKAASSQSKTDDQ